MYSYSNVVCCCFCYLIDMGNIGKDMWKGRFEVEWFSVKGICLYQFYIVVCVFFFVY